MTISLHSAQINLLRIARPESAVSIGAPALKQSDYAIGTVRSGTCVARYPSAVIEGQNAMFRLIVELGDANVARVRPR